MAKELERHGIPTALITAMSSVAQSVGTPRIVAAQSIIHPTGNPALDQAGERAERRRITELALSAVCTAVDGPRVFTLEASGVSDSAVRTLWLH
jgi:glycine/betaine/sarcosine/D-proline reductase family selenoprotein B